MQEALNVVAILNEEMSELFSDATTTDDVILVMSGLALESNGLYTCISLFGVPVWDDAEMNVSTDSRGEPVESLLDCVRRRLVARASTIAMLTGLATGAKLAVVMPIRGGEDC